MTSAEISVIRNSPLRTIISSISSILSIVMLLTCAWSWFTAESAVAQPQREALQIRELRDTRTESFTLARLNDIDKKLDKMAAARSDSAESDSALEKRCAMLEKKIIKLEKLYLA